jgi:hypothetical protein
MRDIGNISLIGSFDTFLLKMSHFEHFIFWDFFRKNNL